jgi:hypothetical protein
MPCRRCATSTNKFPTHARSPTTTLRTAPTIVSELSGQHLPLPRRLGPGVQLRLRLHQLNPCWRFRLRAPAARFRHHERLGGHHPVAQRFVRIANRQLVLIHRANVTNRKPPALVPGHNLVHPARRRVPRDPLALSIIAVAPTRPVRQSPQPLHPRRHIRMRQTPHRPKPAGEHFDGLGRSSLYFHANPHQIASKSPENPRHFFNLPCTP